LLKSNPFGKYLLSYLGFLFNPDNVQWSQWSQSSISVNEVDNSPWSNRFTIFLVYVHSESGHIWLYWSRR
jgi:hypothetical protein